MASRAASLNGILRLLVSFLLCPDVEHALGDAGPPDCPRRHARTPIRHRADQVTMLEFHSRALGRLREEPHLEFARESRPISTCRRGLISQLKGSRGSLY
jgi:hypothetical protein